MSTKPKRTLNIQGRPSSPTPLSGGGPKPSTSAASSDFQGLAGLIRKPNPIQAPSGPKSGSGLPGPAQIGPADPPPAIPGVSGITPGAVERRLGIPATLQVNTPQPPSQVFQHQPGGLQQGQVSSPIQNILALLQQRMQGQQQ